MSHASFCITNSNFNTNCYSRSTNDQDLKAISFLRILAVSLEQVFALKAWNFCPWNQLLIFSIVCVKSIKDTFTLCSNAACINYICSKQIFTIRFANLVLKTYNNFQTIFISPNKIKHTNPKNICDQCRAYKGINRT